MYNKNKNIYGNFVESNFKQEVVSITYEEIGLFPRSFSRVFDRFLKQVFSDVENLVIQEYRFYRYLFLTTLKCVLILFFVPFIGHFFAKNYLVRPLTEYFWNTKQTEIFLNSYQQKRAFAELKDFEEKLYFESLILPKSQHLSSVPFVSSSPFSSSTMGFDGLTKMSESKNMSISMDDNKIGKEKTSISILRDWQKSLSETEMGEIPERSKRMNDLSSFNKESESQTTKTSVFDSKDDFTKSSLLQKQTVIPRSARNHWSELERTKWNAGTMSSAKQRLQEKTIELAIRYNNQSIEAITNFFADLISFLTLFYLLFALEIQINITKSFLLEVFFGLDDSKKSLLILLITDLLVGYHSSNIWELFFEFLLNHYGLPESQTGIFLLVATLPVLLDVLFKYLIFRHLNRSSPATVATYHAMIE